MVRIENTEQWLLDGDCDKCRRSKHCGKQCTANKRFQMRKLQGLAVRLAVEVASKATRELDMSSKN